MDKVTITIEIDSELKEQMDMLCSEFGTTIEEVLVNFMAYVVKNKKMPFTDEKFTTLSDYMNNETKVSIEEKHLIEKAATDIGKRMGLEE